ncbi:MAG: arginine repressor [Clostridiales Family XIII bacterium]|jgi:transcriptional regulator of arginine metabolism|nr:arginine repressor [Clostridiales Family XIII bacterium]
MRYSRQNKILELIGDYEIDTQEKLANMLKNSGFDVTQATVSRDIRELRLFKTPTASGKHKYTAADHIDHSVTDRFVKIFKETIRSVASSGNIVVVKTLPGCANAAAESIDSLDFAHVLGTIAGDNTLMLIADDPGNVPALVEQFDELLQ